MVPTAWRCAEYRDGSAGVVAVITCCRTSAPPTWRKHAIGVRAIEQKRDAQSALASTLVLSLGQPRINRILDDRNTVEETPLCTPAIPASATQGDLTCNHPKYQQRDGKVE